ncbi:hypothetical protein [Aeromonas popoffii]|uniref:hypothetical protein n=1 Tax=Aeromonas popoffii TaxID=70856 RepID=UPI0012EE82C9|nr:hypothetical protein [Aeromonas popoffii]
MKLIVIINTRPLKIPPIPKKVLKLSAIISFVVLSGFITTHAITAYEINQAKLAWEKKESESFRKFIADDNVNKGIYEPVNLNATSPKFTINSEGKVEAKFNTSP